MMDRLSNQINQISNHQQEQFAYLQNNHKQLENRVNSLMSMEDPPMRLLEPNQRFSLLPTPESRPSAEANPHPKRKRVWVSNQSDQTPRRPDTGFITINPTDQRRHRAETAERRKCAPWSHCALPGTLW